MGQLLNPFPNPNSVLEFLKIMACAFRTLQPRSSSIQIVFRLFQTLALDELWGGPCKLTPFDVIVPAKPFMKDSSFLLRFEFTIYCHRALNTLIVNREICQTFNTGKRKIRPYRRQHSLQNILHCDRGPFRARRVSQAENNGQSNQ